MKQPHQPKILRPPIGPRLGKKKDGSSEDFGGFFISIKLMFLGGFELTMNPLEKVPHQPFLFAFSCNKSAALHAGAALPAAVSPVAKGAAAVADRGTMQS